MQGHIESVEEEECIVDLDNAGMETSPLQPSM